jgi:hypothetical protein
MVTAKTLDGIFAKIAKVRADIRVLRRLKLPVAERRELARLSQELDEIKKDANETKRDLRRLSAQ